MTEDDELRSEYDFSKAERGKFYVEDAELRMPIYLDTDLQVEVEKIARKKGKQVGEVVGRMVGNEVQILRELG